MSLGEAQRFYQKIQRDADFFQLFNNTVFETANDDHTLAIVDFAQNQGFNFSVEEFRQLMTEPESADLIQDSSLKNEALNTEAIAPALFNNDLNAKLSVNKLERFFIWLSGASPTILASCPESEQKKHAALGGAVLIPALLAIVTASFLLYTLNFNPYVIVPVALLWSGIVLLMDRAILATYRKSFSFWGKFWQFSLRFVIALLIAVTVAHPIVLLLFSERIEAAYNVGRIKVERENLALECDLKNPQSDLRLLDQKIAEQRNELKSSSLLFEPTVCQNNQPIASQIEAVNLEKLTQELENLKTKQAQADQDVTLFIANAEKEKLGVESNGFTGVPGCRKGTQCKHWLSQASDRKDDSIKLGKEIVSLEAQINALNEKITNQFIDDKQSSKKQCDRELEALKNVRVKQHDLEQLSLESLNNQRDLKVHRCSDKEADITQLKPDVLTQTELLTQLIFTEQGISLHNMLIFIIFMLLFLAIDMMAVVLKMTHIGLYETKVDIVESHNQLLEFINKRQQTLKQFSELVTQEQKIIEHLNHNLFKQDLDDNLKTFIRSYLQADRQKLARFFKV